jgi:restriction endonuclease S subunit
MGLVPSERLDPLYLWHWLQGVDLGKLADGSNVPQLTAPQMRGLALPVPPLETR